MKLLKVQTTTSDFNMWHQWIFVLLLLIDFLFIPFLNDLNSSLKLLCVKLINKLYEFKKE